MHTKNNFETLALKYWKQSTVDLKQAKSNFKKKKYTQAATLACQASNNALASFCIAHKKHQNPHNSLSDMLDVCIAIDQSFSAMKPQCQLLDQINAFSFFSNNQINQMDEKKSVDFFNAAEIILELIKKHQK